MAVFLSKRDMSDLLVTAWEGGSNYWIESADYIPPKGMTLKDLRRAAWEAAPEEDKNLWKEEGPGGRWPLYSLLPFLPPSVKWKIKFTGSEGDDAVLTPENMRQAIVTLSKKDGYEHLVGNIKAEEYDAADADAWLQAAVFGDVIFG